MRSSGVAIRNLLLPVIAFACLAWLVALINSNYWEPRVNYRFKLMRNDISMRSISTEVRPRVFEERFSNQVLYIREASTEHSRWEGIFLADVTDKDEPKITLARYGNLISYPQERKLQLHLSEGAVHSVVNKNPEVYRLTTFDQTDIPVASLSSNQTEDTAKSKITEMDTSELLQKRVAVVGGCLELPLRDLEGVEFFLCGTRRCRLSHVTDSFLVGR